ncbi:cation transport protein [Grosmannia clavigera kw1407]|uniref:glutathione-specific gamma-glutamylcyclotransferase n=1 Tax=Grosmannia clavigera (strain kw1407 / UAMH 11150) TaxID=655863 RepID=F0XSD6_GROCL|nr:cation transport protein [Grosmannia clavigera kw1407]EFW99596.1 cation transport protein [Grosmannia clavigera kw1407]
MSALEPPPTNVPSTATVLAVAPTVTGTSEFWIFGYGRIPGWVNGYVRRFWQKVATCSEDHRGTPEAPGRVVTLIERSFWESLTDHHASASEKTWGVAYRIAAEHAAEVREYLDIREINGYTIHYTPFYPADKSPAFTTMVYIGTPDNAQFTGPQDVQSLAEHISRSSGPSGPNIDYLWGLESALDELSPESGDEHITDLSNRARAINEQFAAADRCQGSRHS